MSRFSAFAGSERRLIARRIHPPADTRSDQKHRLAACAFDLSFPRRRAVNEGQRVGVEADATAGYVVEQSQVVGGKRIEGQIEVRVAKDVEILPSHETRRDRRLGGRCLAKLDDPSMLRRDLERRDERLAPERVENVRRLGSAARVKEFGREICCCPVRRTVASAPTCRARSRPSGRRPTATTRQHRAA